MTRIEGRTASHEFKSEFTRLEYRMRMELDRQAAQIFAITCLGSSVLFLLFTLLVKSGH